MAARVVSRHLRSIRRAIRRLRQRQIKPAVASRVIMRSSWGLVRALVVLILVLLAASLVAVLMVSGSIVRKVKNRKPPDIAV